MWHKELPAQFIAKQMGNQQLHFKVSRVKGLLLMINKIFDTHVSQNK